MMRAYGSEWLKLRRPAMILGGAGSMVGFAILAIVLLLRRLSSVPGGPGAREISAATVAASDGFAALMAFPTTFIGVIALSLCAIAVGAEYSSGMLRNLLVRQPSRPRLLIGKLAALGTFVAVGALVAYGAALVTALLLVPSHGISTAAWFTSAGTQSLLSTAGNLVLATLSWGALGAFLALVLRSTAAAIASGLAYALVVENLLITVWSDGKQWLPGQLIDVIARGGTSTVSYTSALLLVLLYVSVALGGAGLLFRRRDVAA